MRPSSVVIIWERVEPRAVARCSCWRAYASRPARCVAAFIVAARKSFSRSSFCDASARCRCTSAARRSSSIVLSRAHAASDLSVFVCSSTKASRRRSAATNEASALCAPALAVALPDFEQVELDCVLHLQKLAVREVDLRDQIEQVVVVARVPLRATLLVPAAENVLAVGDRYRFELGAQGLALVLQVEAELVLQQKRLRLELASLECRVRALAAGEQRAGVRLLCDLGHRQLARVLLVEVERAHLRERQLAFGSRLRERLRERIAADLEEHRLVVGGWRLVVALVVVPLGKEGAGVHLEGASARGRCVRPKLEDDERISRVI
jgi:hypothetical protein